MAFTGTSRNIPRRRVPSAPPPPADDVVSAPDFEQQDIEPRRERYHPEISGRRVCSRFTLAASSTVRIIFGPFEPFGDKINGIWLYMDSVDSAIVAAGESITINPKAFLYVPQTSAEFAENGRNLIQGTALPQIPVISRAYYFPVQFVPIDQERYLGFEFTESATHNWLGSLWLDAA